jgi:hypothetical protein
LTPLPTFPALLLLPGGGGGGLGLGG